MSALDSALDSALSLAASGHPVVWVHAPLEGGGCTCGRPACSSQGKHPILSRWTKLASTDPCELRDQRAKISFEPNVGIALGERSDGSYVVAIDVDDDDRLVELEAEHGPLPPTLAILSARGAKRLYSLAPDVPRDRLRNRTGVGGSPGVDAKVAGGQVVAPPSVHRTGATYTWDERPIVDLPAAWCLLLLDAPKIPKPLQGYTPQTLAVDARARRRAEKYYESAVIGEATLVARAAEGGRNSALHHALCTCVSLADGLSLSRAYAVRELSRASALPEPEVQRTVASVERWAAEVRPERQLPAPTPLPHVAPEACEPPPPPADPLELIMDGEWPAKIAENVARVLAAYKPVRLDRFTGRILWEGDVEHSDSKTCEIQAWLYQYRVRAGIEVVEQGVRLAAEHAAFDALTDRVNALPEWDGVARLSTWLTDYAAAEDTPVNRLFARRWVISCVARALVPGCVADIVLVLEGEQGIGKNRLLEALFGAYPWVQPIGAYRIGQDLEADRIASRAWVVHDDELGSTNGARIEQLKSWISQREKLARYAFERNPVHVVRRAVLAGSTNDGQYLRDRGNRRFCPVACGGSIRLDIPSDQILAEALAAYRAGEAWTIQRDDPAWSEIEETQDERRVVDDLDGSVRSVLCRPPLSPYGNLPLHTSMGQILEALGVAHERRDREITSRVGVVLASLGYVRKRVRVVGGRTYVYNLVARP